MRLSDHYQRGLVQICGVHEVDPPEWHVASATKRELQWGLRPDGTEIARVRNTLQDASGTKTTGAHGATILG